MKKEDKLEHEFDPLNNSVQIGEIVLSSSECSVDELIDLVLRILKDDIFREYLQLVRTKSNTNYVS